MLHRSGDATILAQIGVKEDNNLALSGEIGF
jgi:hypothetical protein